VGFLEEASEVAKWGIKMLSSLFWVQRCIIHVGVISGTLSTPTPRIHPITWFVFIFLWFNIIRVLLCLSFIDNDFNDFHIYFGDLAFVYAPQKYRLYINLTILTWTSNAAVMFTIIRWHIISRRSSLMKDWLNRFDELWIETTPDLTEFENKSKKSAKDSDLCESQKLFKRIVTVFVLIYVMTCTFITISGTLLNWHLIKPNLLAIHIIWCFVYIFWCGLQMIINATCLSVHLFFCKALTLRFRQIHYNMKAILDNKLDNSDDLIVKLLTKHHKICQMVLLANRHLKTYLLTYFVVFLPNISFLGHHLLFYKNFWEVKGGFAVFACCSLLEMLLVLLNTAHVYYEAHRPRHSLHGIVFRLLSNETRFQVTLSQ
jgi:hypothetical protein